MRRRITRAQAVALSFVMLAVGTQLDRCNQHTPHDQPTAPKSGRALVTTQEMR